MRLFATVAIIALVGGAVSAQSPTEEQLKRRQAEEKAAVERRAALERLIATGAGSNIFVGGERVALERSVKGAPYSAEMLIEFNQTLPDGNRINQRSTGRVYRDTEGRTRREEDRSNGTVAISIVDPVAGVSYSLDPESRIAWKTASQTSEDIMKKIEAKRREERAQMERRGAGEPNKEALELETRRKREAEMEAAKIAGARVERGPAAEEHKEGPLERKTIEGVAVEGRRRTTTIRAGAIGNDLPITISSEEWSSPDLQVLVMTRRNDPRNGESFYKLTNIVRAEPDRSLFQVPADYSIKETGIRKFEEAKER